MFSLVKTTFIREQGLLWRLNQRTHIKHLEQRLVLASAHQPLAGIDPKPDLTLPKDHSKIFS